MRANIAPLVADTGELRLMRRMGSFAYGRWEVEWPKDFEAPKLDDGVKLGYVARMMKEDPGLSGRRFSRRDVAINAVDKTSDVEQILDAAESAVKEHVFFESELTGVGLAHQVPGEDFQLGDLVPVLVCGRVLPDQLVTNIRWALQDGVSECFVQIGSQVLADDLERARQNREVTRAIAQERRERVVDVSNAAASAAEAKAAAKVADRKAGAADAKAVTAQETAEDALEKWRQQKDQLDKVQSAQIEANAKANDAQQRAIDLGFLFNHGEWIMSKEWKANAGESKVMDFDTELSTPRGCESTAITSNGETVGHGIRFLSPGFWRLYARVLIPWVGLIQASAVHVSIVVMGKTGKSIAKSKYALVVDTAPSTASFPMTVEIPEAGCYAYVEVHTSKALNQSIVPGEFVNPENNEFSAQQISKIF